MKQVIKKAFSVLLLLSLVLSLLSVNIFADRNEDLPNTDKANAVCLYNINTEAVVYQKNMNARLFPSGAVKMITGLIACEMLADRLSETVTVTEQMLSGVQGANINLRAGMSVSAENLLYGVLCGGGNDAAIVLANLCSGSTDAFVERMNSACRKWGLKSTNITNPTGIDDKEMYSSLSDVMIVARRAYQNSLYMKISSEKFYSFTPTGGNKISFSNKNKLIKSVDHENPYAEGLCVGNTDLGGCSVISSATLGDTRYICAVMGADEESFYSTANDLIYHALDELSYVKIAAFGQYICSVDTRLSLPDANEKARQVPCTVIEDVYVLTDRRIDVENDITYRYYLHNTSIDAPVKSGMIVGGVDFIYDGEVIGSSPIITSEALPASTMLLLLDNMKSFFTHRIVVFSVLFFIALSFIYWHYIDGRIPHKKYLKK